jgi:hypothetical protein
VSVATVAEIWYRFHVGINIFVKIPEWRTARTGVRQRAVFVNDTRFFYMDNHRAVMYELAVVIFLNTFL